VRNAQSRPLLEEMDRAFLEAEADPEVRVIVLSGNGETFSAGHDLGSPQQRADTEARPAVGLSGRYQRIWDLYIDMGLRWRNLPKPTIAMVQGYCIFGGWMIASAMDLIVAAADAKFLASHFQYFSVPYDVGVRKAKELLFEFRFLHAEEAERAITRARGAAGRKHWRWPARRDRYVRRPFFSRTSRTWRRNVWPGRECKEQISCKDVPSRREVACPISRLWKRCGVASNKKTLRRTF